MIRRPGGAPSPFLGKPAPRRARGLVLCGATWSRPPLAVTVAVVVAAVVAAVMVVMAVMAVLVGMTGMVVIVVVAGTVLLLSWPP